MDLIKRFASQPAPDHAEIIRALAIDLGTTNSATTESVWMPGYPPMCRVLEVTQPLPGGSYTSALTPSTVAVTGNNAPLIGEGARRLRGGPRKALSRVFTK